MSGDGSSPLTVAVVVEDAGWTRDLPDAATVIERAVRAALPGAAGEVAVLLADDARLADLNQRYRGRPGPTNVLSFPGGDGGPHDSRQIGDIALARETLLREAAAAGKPPAAHLAHLAVHGALHLIGHAHDEEAEAALMEAREIEILAGLGVADPYRPAEIEA